MRAAPSIKKLVILVVKDDDDAREQINELLTGDGHQALPIRDGAQAMAVLGQLKPDLILLDLMLPVMSGWEVLGELRSSPSLAIIPVIVMSAYVDEALIDVTLVLRKPVSLDEIRDAVSRFC